MQGDPTESVLSTETAQRVALMIREAGYELQVSPGKGAADLGAARNGVVWATFHVGYDAKRPLFLRIGATVWGGARQDWPDPIAYDDETAWSDGRLASFVRERLALACKRGLEQDPGHCDACPMGERHRARKFSGQA